MTDKSTTPQAKPATEADTKAKVNTPQTAAQAKAGAAPIKSQKNEGHLETSRRAERAAVKSGEKDRVLGDKNLLKTDPLAPQRSDNSLHPDYKPNDPPQDPFDSVGANPTAQSIADNRSSDGPLHKLARRADDEAEANQQGNDDGKNNRDAE